MILKSRLICASYRRTEVRRNEEAEELGFYLRSDFDLRQLFVVLHQLRIEAEEGEVMHRVSIHRRYRHSLLVREHGVSSHYIMKSIRNLSAIF